MNEEAVPVDGKTQDKLLARMNETGFLLEHRAQRFFNDPKQDLPKHNLVEKFRAWTSIPYVYPEGQRGEIDVRGVAVGNDFGERKAALYVIECKRPMDEANNWLFFQKDEPEREQQEPYIYKQQLRDRHETNISQYVNYPRLGINHTREFPYVHQGIEISDKFESITKRDDERMYKPLLQAMRGTFATILKPGDFLDYLLGCNIDVATFLPVILTSADLYVSHHKYNDISLSDGTLPTKKRDFQKVDWVAYQFPVWDYLKISDSELKIDLKTDYLTIFIVKSSFLPRFVLGTCPRV